MIESIFNILSKYQNTIIEGIIGTLWISTLVVTVSTFVGGLLAFAGYSKIKPVRWIISFLVDFIRGTPILLQLYFFVYGVQSLMGGSQQNTLWVIVALIINSSAYVSEIFRAGINAVDKGQFEAALSLGLSKKDMMVKVILPQAIKNILPALGNEFIMMIKETSLAAIFFIPSLMTAEKIISTNSYKRVETMIIIGFIYYFITTILNRVFKRFERKSGVNVI